jgi:YVTN family beta-propeller protein
VKGRSMRPYECARNACDRASGPTPLRRASWAGSLALMSVVVVALMASQSVGVISVPSDRALSAAAPGLVNVPSSPPSVTVSPSVGTVNSTAAVTGNGFPQNSSIQFEVMGNPVSSDCFADGNGSFPGATGTPCELVVPPAISGPLPIQARGSGFDSIGLNDGWGNGIGYDPNAGELFAANESCLGTGCNGTVNVINQTTFAVTANFTVGPEPVGIAYDSGTNQIFVVNQQACIGTFCDGDVSVFDASNDSLVTNITVGSYPSEIAYDAGTGELWVTNTGDCVGSACNGDVSVINDTNDSVVATVVVGESPVGIAYSSSTGQIFVANPGECLGGIACDGTVSVINDTLNSVVTNITVGTAPYGQLAYDSGMGEVFVPNTGACLGTDCNGTVTVIDATNDSAIANITVGSGPEGIAYERASGQLFVPNINACVGGGCVGTVSVIKDSSDGVVATVLVSQAPVDVAVDDATGQAWVSDNGVSVIQVAPPSNASTTFAVVPSLSVYPAAGGVGTSLAATGFGFGANSTISLSFGSISVGPVCRSNATGSFPTGSGNPCVITVPDLALGVYNVSATNGTDVANATYTITAGLELSQASGPVGSVLTATGSNFSANATITINFDGSPVTSVCSSDSSGSFPGLSGTPCAFTVPPSPGGEERVSAMDGSTVAGAFFFVNESLTVTAWTGRIGSVGGAEGTGYPANTAILFELDGASAGVPTGTRCTTDANGSFPGTSGTGCNFLIPPVPGGPESLEASPVAGYTNYALPNVPWGADSLAYDPSQQEVFVSGCLLGVFGSCSGGTAVTVINATNATPVAHIAVGSASSGIAYDSGTRQLFVARSILAGAVTIIDAANDTIAGTVSVGSSPLGVAYDPERSEVFVANFGSNTVSVIADSNDSVIDTISIPNGDPAAVAYDPGSGEIFVTDRNLAEVSVINDTNDSVVATLPVGTFPIAVTSDPITGDVFVVNSANNNVSVINGSDNEVLGSIPVGNQPSGVAFDVVTDRLVVANSYQPVGPSGVDLPTASIISPTNLTVVATVVLGDSASVTAGVVCDSNSGQIFVAENSISNVSVINVTLANESGTAPVPIHTSLELSTDLLDVGQPFTAEGLGFGASTAITSETLGSYVLMCTFASTGNCTGGIPATDNEGAFTASYTVPTVSASGSYLVSFSDDEGNSALANVTVDTDPTLGSISATRTSLDLGQNVGLSVSASSGSGGYSFQWSGLPPGCVSTQEAFNCTPETTPGNYSVTASVTDSNGFSVTSSPLELQVFSDPTIESVNASIESGEVDAGQSVDFHALAQGGTGVFVSFTWSGLPSGCEGDAITVTCSGPDLPAGNYSIKVTATDSNGATSPTSSVLYFAVDSDPRVSLPVTSRSAVDVGQTATFSVQAENGSGLYSYVWEGLPTGCIGGSSPVVSCDGATPGTSSVSVVVTDSNDYSVTSPSAGLTVYADPTVVAGASRAQIDLNQSVTLTAVVALGSGGDSYSWSGLPANCANSTVTVSCTIDQVGVDTVRVSVTDSNGWVVESAALRLTIAPAITASVSASPSPAQVGEGVSFDALASGGTGPLAYGWLFGDGSRGNGSSATQTYDLPGNYSVLLWVNDTVGESVEKSVTISVLPVARSASPPSSGLSVTDEAAIGIVAIAVIAILAFVLTRRRKPSASAPSNEMPGSTVAKPTNEPEWEGSRSEEEDA